MDGACCVGRGVLRASRQARNARIYVSGKSAEARNITEQDLQGKPAEFAMPARLVQLAAEADVVLVY